jgi:hypothetical protein
LPSAKPDWNAAVVVHKKQLLMSINTKAAEQAAHATEEQLQMHCHRSAWSCRPCAISCCGDWWIGRKNRAWAAMLSREIKEYQLQLWAHENTMSYQSARRTRTE